jgi:hypothetical protein
MEIFHDDDDSGHENFTVELQWSFGGGPRDEGVERCVVDQKGTECSQQIPTAGCSSKIFVAWVWNPNIFFS